MRIVLFGSQGQVAQSVQRVAASVGVHLTVLGREAFDLSAENIDERLLLGLARSADAIINATAYTAVDKAEEEPDLAARLNAHAPGLLARAAADAGIPFLHVSTDYVFDGSGDRPRRPDDVTAPLGVYGQTKRDGEVAVTEAGGQSLILRTSWVFSPVGSNFVRTMLRLGAERDEIGVVSDQIGGPTPAQDIAAALLTMAHMMQQDAELGGVHHFAGAPDVSWAEFAAAVMRHAGLSCRVRPIPSAEYPTPAPRPANSRLDCRSTTAAFGIPRPDWRAGLVDVLRELGQLSDRDLSKT